jgi:hypothetical protein
MGLDGGQKVPRELCGDPKFLSPEEIEKLSIKPPRRWIEKPRRPRRYDIP